MLQGMETTLKWRVLCRSLLVAISSKDGYCEVEVWHKMCSELFVSLTLWSSPGNLRLGCRGVNQIAKQTWTFTDFCKCAGLHPLIVHADLHRAGVEWWSYVDVVQVQVNSSVHAVVWYCTSKNKLSSSWQYIHKAGQLRAYCNFLI